MKRTAWIIAALLAVLLVLPGAALLAKDKVLNFALSGNPDSLDPHKTSGTLTFQTLKSIYDTLVEANQKEKIVPALAESWSVSEDSLTWTFKIRPGIVFHNGDKLTSKDVKATFDRVRDKAIASPKASEFAAIASVDTPDDATVVIKLAKPFAPFLAVLASGWGAILPKGLIDSGHDFASKPVGTGPFMLKEFTRDSRIVLVKNKSYWMTNLPKLDQVIFNVIPERAVQVQGLLSGAIDAVEFVDVEDIKLLQQSADVQVNKSLSALILVMSINCSNPLLSNPKVRQAVTMAIDKQKVLDAAYGGGVVIGTFLDAANGYYQDFTKLYPYNPATGEGPACRGEAAGRCLLRAGDPVQLRHAREGGTDVPGDAVQGRPEREDQARGLADVDQGRVHRGEVRLHGDGPHGQARSRRHPGQLRNDEALRALGQPRGGGPHREGGRRC